MERGHILFQRFEERGCFPGSVCSLVHFDQRTRFPETVHRILIFFAHVLCRMMRLPYLGAIRICAGTGPGGIGGMGGYPLPRAARENGCFMVFSLVRMFAHAMNAEPCAYD